MLFTPEEEQQIIMENMPKIYRAVDNFMMRCSSQVIRIPYEDFVQEVSIVLLEYIRKCNVMDELQKFPWYSAMDAMRKLVLVCQPLTCPSAYPDRFMDIIHNMPKTMSVDAIEASSCIDVDGMGKHWVDDKETQMDFDAFMDSQPENTRRIASMRVYGMTMKEIGEQCGVSKVAIKKRLDKLNVAYKQFMEGEENAE